MSRVVGDKIALDSSDVARFFEQRAQKFNEETPLTSVLYQDGHPEIAQKRDAIERERILPLLELTGAERVLDVGCGIGRWATAICNHISSYCGIDASPALIEIARRYCVHPDVEFQVASTDDLTQAWLAARGPFDRIICSGILIYLDDAQVASLLAAVCRNLAPGAIVYLREPMGVSSRLTLSAHWSEELQAHYSAIYRSREEFASFIEAAFPASSHEINGPRLLFEDPELNNRSETQQHFCIVRKAR